MMCKCEVPLDVQVPLTEQSLRARLGARPSASIHSFQPQDKFMRKGLLSSPQQRRKLSLRGVKALQGGDVGAGI